MTHNQPPVHFVISAPRSGSTWLARALNGHPEILATENRLFGMFSEIWQNRNGRPVPRITADRYLLGLAQHSFWSELGFDSAAELQQDLLNQWIRFLFSYLQNRSGKRIIVDKVTPYLGTSTVVCLQIQSHFPDARLVHLVRDGRDVVTSGVFDWLGRQPAGEDHPRDDFFIHGHSHMVLDRLFDDSTLQTWCRYWTEPILAVQQSKPNATNVMMLRYEEMLDDHASKLRAVFEFLGVDPDPAIAARCAANSTFQKTTGRSAGQADPLSKARRGVSGDWTNWFTRQDAELFHQLAGQVLIEQGYAADDSWIEQCPNRLGSASQNP